MNRRIEYFFSDRSPAEVIHQEPLHTLSKEVKTTTLKSTELYTDPAEVAEIVPTWLNANNTSSARNEVLAREVLEVCRFIFLLAIC